MRMIEWMYKKYKLTHLEFGIYTSHLIPLSSCNFKLVEVTVWLPILSRTATNRKNSINVFLTHLIDYLWMWKYSQIVRLEIEIMRLKLKNHTYRSCKPGFLPTFILNIPPNSVTSNERAFELLLCTDSLEFLTPGSRPSNTTNNKIDLKERQR
jgi:hypothetical protein